MVPATRTTDVEKVTDVLTAGFKDSTLTAFVLRTPESTWPVDNIPEDILRPFMLSGTTKKEALGAQLVEAGDYAAAAIWFPPGVDLPPRPDDDERTLEYRNVWSKIKKEHLQGRRYWYLNMIARHPERREPGMVRALFDPYIARARAEGIPLWLESISEHSRQVYEHLGFRTVAEARIGVGKASARGELQDGGEGVLVYGMIYE